MSGSRFLVCVDRSRAAIESARLAVDLAGAAGRIRVISVLDDGAVARQVDALGRQEQSAGRRLEEGVRAVLGHVVKLADDRGVHAEAELLRGDPLPSIIHDARRWDPDLIFIGRTGRSGPGSPLVGSLAMHVVEFTEWPVVIVPEASGAARPSRPSPR